MADGSVELIPNREQEVTLTPHEWQLLAMLFKNPDLNTLRTVWTTDNPSLDETLNQLKEKRLIKYDATDNQPNKEYIQDDSAKVPSNFWKKLEEELSKAIGPIATLVIDDKLDEFGISKEHFPQKYLYTLVEKVEVEISDQSDRKQFQRAMLDFIKQRV
mgnify:CR=1 FL=1